MKILHLVHQYLPDFIGGTELYTQQLAQQLAQRGHRNEIFFRRDGEQAQLEHWQESAGIRVWAVTSKPLTPHHRFGATFGDTTIRQALNRVLRNTRPDVVHIQHLMGLPASLSRTLKHIPTVVTLHDFWWGCANAQLLTNYDQTICTDHNQWRNCARCALARADKTDYRWLSPALAPLFAYRVRLLRQILEQAHTIIAPSQQVKAIHTQWGIPDEAIQVIRHGIHVPLHILPQPRPVGEVLHIGYVGGISWQKGVHVLIEAVNQLPPTQTRLTIVGDETAFPDYTDSLRAQVQHPHVDFAGKIPHNKLWSQLAQFDVLVVPSLWYEGAGLVIQEAFAVGLPVVVSDLGALPESVRAGVDGELFPAGDVVALAQILRGFVQDPTRLTRLSAGIRPVRSIAQHVDDIERLYQKARL